MASSTRASFKICLLSIICLFSAVLTQRSSSKGGGDDGDVLHRLDELRRSSSNNYGKSGYQYSSSSSASSYHASSYSSRIHASPSESQRSIPCGACPPGYIRHGNHQGFECGRCTPRFVVTTRPPPPPPPQTQLSCHLGYTLVENGCIFIGQSKGQSVRNCEPGYFLSGDRCQLRHTWTVPPRRYCPGCYCYGYSCSCDGCHQQHQWSTSWHYYTGTHPSGNSKGKGQ